MTRYKILPLIVFLAALVFFAVPALAQNAGVIEGQLVNKTAPPGGASVAKVTVTLKTSIGGSEQGSKDTTTDQDGKFQFSGLNTASNYSYQLVVIYQTAEYDSDTITFKAGETTQTVNVDVYDATDKADKLRFHASQIEINPGQGRLEITEHYLVNNDGDTTYIGSQPAIGDSQGRNNTLKFSLPAETDQKTLQYSETLMDWCVVIGGGNLQDTMAVLPGQKVVAFMYQVPYKSTEYSFTKTFIYPVANMSVLVKDTGVAASSDTLSGGQQVQYNGANYVQYSAQNIGANTPVTLNLSGLAKSGNSPLKWGGIAAAILVLGVGLGYPLSRRRRVPARVQRQAADRSDDRDELLMRLARLDDNYEAGRMGEAEYNARRAQLKQRLVDMNRQTERRGKA